MEFQLLKRIFALYECFWPYVFDFIDKIPDLSETKSAKVLKILCAILGAMFIEYFYYTHSKEGRLLFVLLLAPVGFALGMVFASLSGRLIVFVLAMTIFIIAGVIFITITFVPVCSIMYVLYNTVLWTHL